MGGGDKGEEARTYQLLESRSASLDELFVCLSNLGMTLLQTA